MKKNKGFIGLIVLVVVAIAAVGAGTYVVVKKSGGVSSARFVDLGFNAIHDSDTGLTWAKCDYGRGGTDCLAPNRCGIGETSNPACLPESEYGKNLNVSCTPNLFPSPSYRLRDDSGIAECDNGVLCNDGAFVVAGSRDEPFDDPKSTQILYATASDGARTAVCADHGGVAISHFRVPTADELKSLFIKEKGGLDQNFFPNSEADYISSTLGSLDSDDPSTPYKEILLKGQISEKECRTSAPLKCVAAVAPQINIQPTGDIFCDRKVVPYPYMYEQEITWKQPKEFQEFGTENRLIREKTFVKDNNTYYSIGYWDNGETDESWFYVGASSTLQYDLAAHGNDTKECDVDTEPIIDPSFGEYTVLSSELTGETFNVNGYECKALSDRARAEKGSFSVRNGLSEEDDQVTACINREYCEFMVDDDLDTRWTITKFSRDMTGANFTPPSNCTRIDTKSDESDTASDTATPATGTGAGGGDACTQKCDNFKAECGAKGMDYDSQGCYVPGKEYHRDCYLECWSK